MSFLSDTNKIKKECSIDLSLKKMNKRGCLLQILVFKKFIYKINPLIAESGDSKSKKFLFEKISLAIQRGNAASIRGTFPDSGLLSEIFVMLNKNIMHYLIQSHYKLLSHRSRR
jgi:hypothetical protein